jgi:hypothetical protein
VEIGSDTLDNLSFVHSALNFLTASDRGFLAAYTFVSAICLFADQRGVGAWCQAFVLLI